MKARYSGRCEWCSNPIQVGEDIHRVSDCWIHENCGIKEQPDPQKDVGECVSCHEIRLLVGEWRWRYCKECWNDLCLNMEQDYGYVHDIGDMPFI